MAPPKSSTEATSEPPSSVMSSLKAFAAALKDQQFDSAFSDFQIICGDATYSVHRLIISLHSGYFKRMCQSAYSEAGSRKVVLQGDHPFAVKTMVDFFYTFDVNITAEDFEKLESGYYNDGEKQTPFEARSWIFTIADKYDIRHLSNIVLEQEENTLSFDIAACSEKLVKYFVNCLLKTTKHAYTEGPLTDDRLRKAIVRRWVAEDKKLLRSAIKEEFDQVLADVPEFASDLIAALGGITMKGAAEQQK